MIRLTLGELRLFRFCVWGTMRGSAYFLSGRLGGQVHFDDVGLLAGVQDGADLAVLGLGCRRARSR